MLLYDCMSKKMQRFSSRVSDDACGCLCPSLVGRCHVMSFIHTKVTSRGRCEGLNWKAAGGNNLDIGKMSSLEPYTNVVV